MLTSFDDAKKIINSKNLMNECYRFNQRSLWPAVVPIPYCLLYMLQSGEYIFTPEFITFYKKLDLEETTVMWEMIHNPSKTTLEMIVKLVFNPRSYTPKDLEKCRYFLIAASNLSSSMSSSELKAQTKSDVCETETQSKANLIIEKIRKSNVVHIGEQQKIDDDYIPLSSDEDSSYDLSQSCPNHIDDMMCIVRKLRTNQYSLIHGTSSFVSTSASSMSYEHNSSNGTNAATNAYDTFNITDLFSG